MIIKLQMNYRLTIDIYDVIFSMHAQFCFNLLAWFLPFLIYQTEAYYDLLLLAFFFDLKFVFCI